MKQITQFANIMTLRKISTLFQTTFEEVDELLNMVLETALQVVGGKNASLLMLNEKTDNLQFYQASGPSSNQLTVVDIPQGVGLAGIVAKTGEPIVSNDVHNDDRWLNEVSKNTDMEVKSIASLPLKLNGQVIGVVQFLDKKDGSPFSESDLATLGQFAQMMAIFFQVTKSNEKLGEEFDRLQEKIRQQYSIVGESPAIQKSIKQAEKWPIRKHPF